MSSNGSGATAGGDTPWRLFVAALLADANRRALKLPIAQLAPLAPLVKASRPEAIHLTLHFLGSVEVERIEAISRGLQEALASFKPFEVEVAGVGAFPSLSRPRVLWAGIGGRDRERLGDLQAATGSALRSAGISIEPRPYAPHLTLGRLRTIAPAGDRAAIGRWAEAWEAVSFGALSIDAIHLMRSDLSQRPPRYSSLKSFPLQ
ncbi:MAG: RNA 2',3'-cyclic phosphodiesterase [Candidatus Dormibacteraeota bacterium]|nr:RNA 2',3'-cyclic phosphodiesterase [Candidatus Dormibacteraeota bacterium]